MSNTRNDHQDEDYETARREHLKSIVVAFSSRRSNREPPRVLTKSVSFFQKEQETPANTQANEDSNDQRKCLPCGKKK